MRMLFLFPITALLISNMICFLGCRLGDNDRVEDEGWVEEMTIEGIEISISEDRPAQVLVTVTAYNNDGCTGDLEVRQERQGNTISLSATQHFYDSIDGGCPQAITGVQEEISIGEFVVGEYKVIADSLELVFHIEDDKSWILRKPIIENIEFLISEDRPAQVTVNVEGYSWETCVPFFETHRKREGDTIYIQITGKIPGSVRCPLVTEWFRPAGRFISRGLIEYRNQISIGEFASGHYTVIVNDGGFRFYDHGRSDFVIE